MGKIKGVPRELRGTDGEIGGDEGLGGAGQGPEPGEFEGQGATGEEGDHSGEGGPVAEMEGKEFVPGLLLVGGKVAEADEFVENEK
jgi:hypothetical protein